MLTATKALEICESRSTEMWKKIEERVDHALTEYCNRDTWPCTIAIDKSWSRGVLVNVINTYRKEGWKTARIVADQRDGDFIQFDKPGTNV